MSDHLAQAIEAAAKAASEQNFFIHGWQPDDFEPMRGPDGEVLSTFDAGIAAAAPHIARGERDRIRTLVEGLRLPNATTGAGHGHGFNTGLDAVLASLDEEGK
jgi:hypothetical protein